MDIFHMQNDITDANIAVGQQWHENTRTLKWYEISGNVKA